MRLVAEELAALAGATGAEPVPEPPPTPEDGPRRQLSSPSVA